MFSISLQKYLYNSQYKRPFHSTLLIVNIWCHTLRKCIPEQAKFCSMNEGDQRTNKAIQLNVSWKLKGVGIRIGEGVGLTLL